MIIKILRVIHKIMDDVYAAVWKNTIGRPCTYIARESAREHPVEAVAIVTVTVLGDFVCMYLFHQWYAILAEFFYPFFLGHLFWDTAGAYIKPKRYRKKE